jgi:hypothetical protein
VKRLTAVAISAVALLLLAPLASAQCTGNPLQALAGTWTFRAAGVGAASFVSAGQFTATIGVDRAGSPLGRLTIVATTIVDGVVIRQEVDAGTYQILPDCSGGTLTINLSTRPIAYDFWFLEGATEMYFVSIINTLPVGGEASRK